MRYIEQQPAIEAALLTKDIKKNAKDVHLLSEEDVTSVEHALTVLGPLKIITTVYSGFENKGFKVFTDNFYMSPKLYKQLEDDGIGVTETVYAT